MPSAKGKDKAGGKGGEVQECAHESCSRSARVKRWREIEGGCHGQKEGEGIKGVLAVRRRTTFFGKVEEAMKCPGRRTLR